LLLTVLAPAAAAAEGNLTLRLDVLAMRQKEQTALGRGRPVAFSGNGFLELSTRRAHDVRYCWR